MNESKAVACKDKQPCHELKTWPQFFLHVWEERKQFEVRKDDRQFKIGDYVILKEWCPDKKAYTGRCVKRRICYMLRGGQFGIEKGYVVMGFEIPIKQYRASLLSEIEKKVEGMKRVVAFHSSGDVIAIDRAKVLAILKGEKECAFCLEGKTKTKECNNCGCDICEDCWDEHENQTCAYPGSLKD